MSDNPDDDEQRTPTEPHGKAVKKSAHEAAKEGDLREHFNRGETVEATVEVPPDENGGERAVGTVFRGSVNNARIFISTGGPASPLHYATHVRVKLSTVKENTLHGQAMYVTT
jgi:hypothetical protein